jgi:hypothetical protein
VFLTELFDAEVLIFVLCDMLSDMLLSLWLTSCLVTYTVLKTKFIQTWSALALFPGRAWGGFLFKWLNEGLFSEDEHWGIRSGLGNSA